MSAWNSSRYFGSPMVWPKGAQDAYEREHPLPVHPWNHTPVAIPKTTRITDVYAQRG